MTFLLFFCFALLTMTEKYYLCCWALFTFLAAALVVLSGSFPFVAPGDSKHA